MSIPKRRNNAKLYRAINLTDGTFINLQKLDKPYARGGEWVIHETTTSPFMHSAVYEKKSDAIEVYELYKSGIKSGIRDEIMYDEETKDYIIRGTIRY